MDQVGPHRENSEGGSGKSTEMPKGRGEERNGVGGGHKKTKRGRTQRLRENQRRVFCHETGLKGDLGSKDETRL